jgi:hypothetical protein
VIYEKVIDGVVVEKVQPVEGDYTDTLLGCKALDYTGGDGWRREGQVVEPAPEPDEQQADEPAAPAPIEPVKSGKSERSTRNGS